MDSENVAPIRGSFGVGAIVEADYEGKYHPATVTDVIVNESTSVKLFRVHYEGWNDRYDQWLQESRVRVFGQGEKEAEDGTDPRDEEAEEGEGEASSNLVAGQEAEVVGEAQEKPTSESPGRPTISTPDPEKGGTPDKNSATAPIENHDFCAICSNGGLLVCCDFCPRSFHSECLPIEPPDSEAPWKCPVCAGDATVEDLVTLSWRRHRRDHVDYCFKCGGGGKLICCDGCRGAYHKHCTSLRTYLGEDEPWLCAVCRGEKTHDNMRKSRAHARRFNSFFIQRKRQGQTVTALRAARRAARREHTRKCAFCRKPGPRQGLVDAGVWVPEVRNLVLVGCELGELKGPWELPSRGGGVARAERVWAHRTCALWAPRVYRAGNEWRNVPNEVARARGVACFECRRGGAAIGCSVATCRRSYHIGCAELAHCHVDRKRFVLYCPHHYLTHILGVGLPDDFGTGLSSKAIEHELAAFKKAFSAAHKRTASEAGLADEAELNSQLQSLKKRYLAQRPYESVAPQFKVVLNKWRETRQKRRDALHKRVEALRSSPPQAKQDPTDGRGGGDDSDYGGEDKKEKESARSRRLRLRREAALAECSQRAKEAREEEAAKLAAATASRSGSGLRGLSAQQEALREAVALPLLYPELISRLGIDPPRGVLLHGPPGTGKTSLARALRGLQVRGRSVSFFHRRGTELLSKFHGESEKNLRDLFAEATARAPAVIFMDEIDGLAPARSPKQNQVYSSVVTTLLSLMDGLDTRRDADPYARVVVIGATNRVDAVDPALRRPGRFGREIRVPMPDRAARAAILTSAAREWVPPPPKELLDDMAEQTRGFSGARLRALCAEAVLAALRRRFPELLNGTETGLLPISRDQWETLSIKRDDFEQATSKVRPPALRAAVGAPGAKVEEAVAARVEAIARSVIITRMNRSPTVPVQFAVSGLVIDGEGSAGQELTARALLRRREMDAADVVEFGPAEAAAAASGPAGAAAAVGTLTRAFSPRSGDAGAPGASRLRVVYLPRIDKVWAATDPLLRATLARCLREARPTEWNSRLLVLATSHVRWSASAAYQLGLHPAVHTFLRPASAVCSSID